MNISGGAPAPDVPVIPAPLYGMKTGNKRVDKCLLTLCICVANYANNIIIVSNFVFSWNYKLSIICDHVWENRSYLHINWNSLFVFTWMLHSCTTQKHQVPGNWWPGLLLQAAFYRCCWTMRIHFSALRGLDRTAWGTKLLQTTVLAHPVDCTSSGPILKAQHCCMNPNGCFSRSSASHPPMVSPSCLPTPYKLNPWYCRHWKIKQHSRSL